MKILAIETSTMLGGVSVMDDTGGLLIETRLNVRTAHSETLMTEIGRVLKQAGLETRDLDVIGVAIGPGSFTGLRIGVSTVKGLSYAAGKPVVAVPSLEALAWNFPYSRYPVCTMFDARRQEVYAAVFRWTHGGFERVMHEVSVRPYELVRSLGEEVIYAGEGALVYRETITEAAGDNALFPPQHIMTPSASNVASLGLRKALKGEYSDPVTLVPFYLRRSEAEIKMENR